MCINKYIYIYTHTYIHIYICTMYNGARPRTVERHALTLAERAVRQQKEGGRRRSGRHVITHDY